MLLKLLIAFFTTLLCFQIYLAIFNKPTLLEGLTNSSETTSEYKPYNMNDPNNSLILAQQNAGNIEVLKDRVDDLNGVKKKVDDMQQSIDSMQTQINGLVQQQAEYANEMAGSKPAEITGTEPETTNNVEESIDKEDN
jgi:hypothetical protein